MHELLLTTTSINNVSSLVVTLTITLYLLSLKGKDLTSWLFIAHIFCACLFYFRNALLYSFNAPEYIRFVFSGMIFIYLSLYLLVPLAYHLHENVYKKESRIVVFLSTLVMIFVGYIIIRDAYANPLSFGFGMHTFLILTSPAAGGAGTIFPLVAIVVFLRKQYRFHQGETKGIRVLFFPKGKAAKSCRNMSSFILLLMVITTLGILIFVGVLPPKIGLPIMLPASLLTYFFFIFIYLQNFPHRSSFLIKIVSASLILLLVITTQIVIETVSWEENSYHSDNLKKIEMVQGLLAKSDAQGVASSALYKGGRPIISDDIQYIAMRPLTDGLFSDDYKLIFTHNRHVSSHLLSLRDKKSKEKLVAKLAQEIQEKNKSYSAEQVERLAIQEIETKDRSKNFVTFKNVSDYFDVFNMSTFFTYYSFILNDKVFEVGFSYLSFRRKLNKLTSRVLMLLIIFTFVVIFILPVFLKYSIVSRLRRLMEGLRKVDRGDLSVKVTVDIGDEIGTMASTFNYMVDSINKHQKELENYSLNLEKMVDERTLELKVAMEELEATNNALVQIKDRLWAEMQLAKKIQTVLLPKEPALKNYEISAAMFPTEEVGGDYYDVIHYQDYDWLVIGDVSGHGVSAGLIMMMVQTSIHVVLSNNPGIRPEGLITAINSAITDNVRRLGEDKYMTITVLTCLENGNFKFSGLHQDIMIYRAGSGAVESVETHGMWLGLVSDIRGLVKDSELRLALGDIMLLYTDGIVEARRKDFAGDGQETDRETYGHNTLTDVLLKHGNESTEAIKEALIKSLRRYRISDDITYVIVKRTR